MSDVEIAAESSAKATDPHNPPGVFRCTNAWRKLLRDWNAKPLKIRLDRVALLAAEPLSRAKIDTYDATRRRPPLPALTWDDVRARLTPDALAAADLDVWTRILVTAAKWAMYPPREVDGYRLALDWAVPFCAAWAGIETAVDAYARLFTPVDGRQFMRADRMCRDHGEGIDELRDLIATLDAPAAQRVRARLADLAAHGGLAAIVAAALLPRDTELIDTALAAFERGPLDAAWQELLRCDLSLAQASRVLADASRVVPDLGLDDDGGLVLDFGARAFRVGFDEELKPFVRDASGARLKDLPKPNRDDVAERARAATDRYKALKKDARALASLQIARFERAMVERRRWSREAFDLFLLGHPWLRHLVRRVLWGAYRGDRVASGSAIGLEHRGWRRDDPSDGIYIGAIVRELPGDLVAAVALDPGLYAGYVDAAAQTLGALTLRRAGTWDNHGRVAFGTLDPIVASELLRDLDGLPTLGDTA